MYRYTNFTYFWDILIFFRIKHKNTSFHRRKCSVQGFVLLSINVTAYYNHSLSDIIVVIVVKEDNISKGNHFEYGDIKSSYKHKRTINSRERGKVVYCLARSKPIALFKYNCCRVINFMYLRILNDPHCSSFEIL